MKRIGPILLLIILIMNGYVWLLLSCVDFENSAAGTTVVGVSITVTMYTIDKDLLVLEGNINSFSTSR
ncbi:hypothetical protein [Kosmotoga pacifica]|uniref:Uncharacterized protein n=1 Tax=Kosmotoga pacifica TaxID=1330330 RepID=A0A0G2ZGZ0_9BACT|nr:hypothetical protein [Kosmotoga pacifica]AKI98023.1 hypothetical protein IX53_09515 [Kosmotoga pacifica]